MSHPLSTDASLSALNALLAEQSKQTLTLKEVADAMGVVPGGRDPTKSEILRMLQEMSDQIDNRFEMKRVDLGLVNDAALLTELFPENEFGMRLYDTQVKMVVRRVREKIAAHRQPPNWEGGPDIMGNLLPPLGSVVSIHLGRSDSWVNHRVTGYTARLVDGQVRLCVDVMDAKGYPNQRAINEINPPVE
ncbi:hypothetical protein uan_112 [Pseudomonas phage UAntarctica]|nr:hypothetical protein uan_112 [Pseudomonas phage UAntarctica]